MNRPALSAERFFHLDGYNGWGFADREHEVAHDLVPGVVVTRDGITLARGNAPAADVPPQVTAGARARGLAFDRLGRAYAVRDDRRGLCRIAGCERDPSPCWDLEPRPGRFIRGLAIDARERLHVATYTRLTQPERYEGEVLVLRISPAGEVARIPMVRPVGVAIDRAGRVSVLDTGAGVPPSTGDVLPPVERIARQGDAIAASPEGALAIATYGATSIEVRLPGGADFLPVELGRATTPAIAFARVPDEEGGELVFVGDQGTGRIIQWRITGLGEGTPRATPVRWSVAVGAWAALAWHGEELFALGRDCSIERIELEAAGFYERSRRFVIGPLDSGVPGTEWHRVTASLAADPNASVGVAVEILADDDCDTYDRDLQEGDSRWEDVRELVSPRHGAPAELAFEAAKGRYAYLRFTLHGDGREAPLLRWLRVEYPRNSYLRYLPAAFSEDPTSRSFAARFLSIFEAANVELASKILHLRTLFEPYAMDPEFFRWLSERLDIVLQPDWPEARTRKALADAFWWFSRRGTRQAMERLLADHGGPGITILEGHRQRSAFFLGTAALGCGTVLPGGCGPARAQLDRGVRLGAAKLDSRPFMEADAITERRGELEIYLPPVIAAQPELVARVTRIAELEAPAGSSVRIVAVAPGARLSYVGRLGIDAALGARSPWRLAAEGEPPPQGVLFTGGMLLARDPGTSGDLALGRGPRLGMDSKL